MQQIDEEHLKSITGYLEEYIKAQCFGQSVIDQVSYPVCVMSWGSSAGRVPQVVGIWIQKSKKSWEGFSFTVVQCLLLLL